MYINHMHHLLCLFCTAFVYRHQKYISMNNINIRKVNNLTCWRKIQYKFNKKNYIKIQVTSMSLFNNYQEGHKFFPSVFHTGHIRHF